VEHLENILGISRKQLGNIYTNIWRVSTEHLENTLGRVEVDACEPPSRNFP
jgi:hypothetical protein